MEPRPQSSRTAHGQPISRQPATGVGRGPEGYQAQPDPATVMAPPRTDYDYSPLDLAPPGQRRRRQLVAAGLGGIVLILLIAAAVFAFLVLRDDDGDGADLAVIATQTDSDAATGQAGTPASATGANEAAAGEPDVAGALDGAVPTATTAPAGAPGEEQAAEPTQPPAPPAGGPTQEELQALLPAAEVLPVLGLDQVTDSALAREDVVAALGGSREAETALDTWGWTANAQRSFTAADPAALAPDATTDLTVSLHSFASDAAAAEALTFYSDILVNSGFQEVEVGDIGATNRMMMQPQEGGGTNVALYVQQGPVLYRIGGYSPAGDPTQNVIALAQTVIGQQAAVGQ